MCRSTPPDNSAAGSTTPSTAEFGALLHELKYGREGPIRDERKNRIVETAVAFMVEVPRATTRWEKAMP